MRASPASPRHSNMAGQLETQPAIRPALLHARPALTLMTLGAEIVPSNAYLAARQGCCRAAMTACLRLRQQRTTHAQVLLLPHAYNRWRRAASRCPKHHASCILHVCRLKHCRIPAACQLRQFGHRECLLTHVCANHVYLPHMLSMQYTSMSQKHSLHRAWLWNAIKTSTQ